MRFGFLLRRLALSGPGKSDAEVTFTRGLNIIAGPSDTGKSFIAQCLDFALGSGASPKDIPEADGYETVVLEVQANADQRIYILERGLRGGDVLCRTEGQSDRLLAAKHKGGEENSVSQFLLDLSGLGTKKVRTNAQGVTRPLSFRDIAPLVIIDEETVIKAESPVLSGQVIHKTVEGGVFRLLVTGTDDSSIITLEDPKVAKGRQAGKVELLEGLLESTRIRLTNFDEIGTLPEEQDRLTRVNASIQNALVERSAAQADTMPLEARRQTAWTTLRAVESKLAVLSELQTRFDLLRDQYTSDLRRLETIVEAGGRLNQLKEELCPLCGALADHQTHHKDGQSLADVAQASKAEAAKTSKLLHDLESTRAGNAAEVELLRTVRGERYDELNAISAELRQLMEQRVDGAAKKVDDLRSRAETCRKVIELLERIQDLNKLLEDANKPKKKEKLDVAGAAVSTAQADPFSKEVEALLKAWHFPDLDRVSFSENDQDVVISGRARKSHGKGVRAIARAAFNLALLRLCIEQERPFPNFVLIDSPLLVYEEPDANESSFPQDIKKHFWDNLGTSFSIAQVIIIENSTQLPQDTGSGNMNIIRFTGSSQGRRGFIPVSS